MLILFTQFVPQKQIKPKLKIPLGTKHEFLYSFGLRSDLYS